MNALIIAVVALIVIVALAIVRQRHPTPYTKYLTINEMIFGWRFIVGSYCGNCIYPAVILCIPEHKGATTLTIRTRYSRETTFYFGRRYDFDTNKRELLPRFWWNSDHLAFHFGKFVDTDFGGFHQVKLPLLGLHSDL
jgi:hypothetical protein